MRCEGPLMVQERSYREYSWKAEFDPKRFCFPTAHRSFRQQTVTNVPAIFNTPVFPKDGGLLSYGANTLDVFRRAAPYFDRVLRGAKPSGLPVQIPTKYELVINLKTAQAFGLTVPLTLQAAADDVIE